jgi:hypothetical protein
MKSADRKPVIFVAKPELPTYASDPPRYQLAKWFDGQALDGFSVHQN